jgi:hypothetical protein
VSRIRHAPFDNDAHRILASICDEETSTKGVIQRRLSGSIPTLRLDQLLRAFEGKGYIEKTMKPGSKTVQFRATSLGISVFESLLVRSLGDRVTALIEETFDQAIIADAAGMPGLDEIARQFAEARQEEREEPPAPREQVNVGSILEILK